MLSTIFLATFSFFRRLVGLNFTIVFSIDPESVNEILKVVKKYDEYLLRRLPHKDFWFPFIEGKYKKSQNVAIQLSRKWWWSTKCSCLSLALTEKPPITASAAFNLPARLITDDSFLAAWAAHTNHADDTRERSIARIKEHHEETREGGKYFGAHHIETPHTIIVNVLEGRLTKISLNGIEA